MTLSTIRALAPEAAELDPLWCGTTLTQILEHPPVASSVRRLSLVVGGAATATVVTATAAAATGILTPGDLLDSFGHEAGRSGTIGTPVLVTDFTTPSGRHFAYWTATSSTGDVCEVIDEDYDGSAPSPATSIVGCAPAGTVEVAGFFTDDDGPMVYGIAPYARAVAARISAPGVDVTVEVRADSHGYGTALPDAGGAHAVTVTFLDAAQRVLGSRTLTAPD